ncbi:hypothetical protein [Shewanella sp. Isolate11]|uniref:hypothetical protein n=1 Tax=Shewanella sp. Isolate11 TaxID=2908530 RepID=UPI001EFD4E41|nr:hypothetical protein [Shewanella sp. Isolate11]MCG9695393.1 hypothetical protein [Shewanella sp. Isolate11]
MKGRFIRVLSLSFIALSFIALSLLGLTACTQVPTWTLFYFAEQDTIPKDAKAHHIAGYYQQLDQCLAKGAGMVKLSESGKGVYQCGFECQDDGTGSVQCQRFEQATAL